jgi:ergothioneine biosynthesis protein EgtB
MSTMPTQPNSTLSDEERSRLIARFRQVRATTERLAEPLSAEDQSLQSMPDCSPTKWHRAHTTWFFETFALAPHGVRSFAEGWGFLFNSYYEALGPRHARPKRGLLSRPSVQEISAYRCAVDEQVIALLERCASSAFAPLRAALVLGLAHEEQHQELLLTDILHAFAQNPLLPAYRLTRQQPAASASAQPTRFVPFEGGLVHIGAAPSREFRFDNEEPRHAVWLDPFELSERPVSVGEFRAFVRDGGYETPSLWLSEGFEWQRANRVRGPLYAELEGGELRLFGLDGLRTAHDDEPLAHVSYYEADAIARYLGGRLPTEAEWETAARELPIRGNFLESGHLRPVGEGEAERGPRQMFGDVWEWTQGSYGPYPGFRAPEGALGEYNGKFMINQIVLRGGSCFTPEAHMRATYRNFWHPHTRFQVSGLRLARS